MRRKLVLLNLVMLALLAAAGWQFRLRWFQARAREEATLARQVALAPAPPVPAAEPVPPVTAADYLEVAEKMVFSKDRNPDVVVEAEPEKPVPAFPVAHGVIDFGDGPTVILSPEAGGPQKGYRAGEKVGPFVLASVTPADVVLEWEGKRFPKSIEELRVKEKERTETGPPSAPPAEGASAGPRSAAQELTPPEKLAEAQRATAKEGGPGIEIGGAVRACSPGDNSPAGTVMGGYRKVISQTPFGSSCRWEPIR